MEKLEIQTGEILDGWIEVTLGLYEKKKVIVGSDRNPTSGQKVLETEWNNDVCLHTWREKEKDITEYEGKVQRALLKDGYFLLTLTVSTIGVMILLGRFFREKELFR
ncbi:MAG: hypothetical protein ACI4E2_00475, partial [Acetatifactor sp.]